MADFVAKVCDLSDAAAAYRHETATIQATGLDNEAGLLRLTTVLAHSSGDLLRLAAVHGQSNDHSILLQSISERLFVLVHQVIGNRDLRGLAAQHQFRTVYTYRVFVTSGGLMTYGPDIASLYRLQRTTLTAFSGARSRAIPPRAVLNQTPFHATGLA